MAHQKANGQINGLVGGMVFYESNGQKLVRSSPTKNDDSNTPAQQAHRNRFRATSTFLKPFRELVKTTFAGFPGKTNAFGAAMAYNMKFGFQRLALQEAIDPSLACISFGIVPLPHSIEVRRTIAGLEFTWDTTLMPGATDHDRVVPVISFDHPAPAIYDLRGTSRHLGRCVIEIPYAGVPVYAWLLVTSIRVKEVSNSIYLGKLGAAI